ncbi:MAG: 50S ribosomal protein L15, partial [Candidatus Sumerlaeia bacterium]|nr:50S ribosomal protein L15 [Candidatus Sumerlaeia bacterium]
MRLHELPGDPTLRKKTKRLGRGHGSGRGKTAGKGHKGLQARSGGHRRMAGFEGGQMPLQRRLPKRGFSNVAFGNPHQAVNLASLNVFGDGAKVDLAALRGRGLARRKLPVKILAKGTLTAKSLTVEAQAFSASARQAIEAAGGA